MEKVKLVFKQPEKTTIEYNGVVIEVTPFLTLAQQLFLVNTYINDYFESPEENIVEMSEYSFMNAEINLLNYILQVCTNVDTEGLDNDLYADTKFWEMLTSKITNYYSFRDKLGFIINEIKQQEAMKNSVGKVLSDLSAKAMVVLDEISKVSPEQIEKIQETGKELMKKLEDNSLLGK